MIRAENQSLRGELLEGKCDIGRRQGRTITADGNDLIVTTRGQSLERVFEPLGKGAAGLRVDPRNLAPRSSAREQMHIGAADAGCRFVRSK